MSNSVFSLLVCPLTKQHLLPPSSQLAEALQAALESNELRYVDGTTVSVDAGTRIRFLITQNQQRIYSVINDIPLLLESRQVEFEV